MKQEKKSYHGLVMKKITLEKKFWKTKGSDLHRFFVSILTL